MTCSAYGGNGPAVNQGGGKAGRQVGAGGGRAPILDDPSPVQRCACVELTEQLPMQAGVKAEAVGGAGLTKAKTEASTQQDSVPRI